MNTMNNTNTRSPTYINQNVNIPSLSLFLQSQKCCPILKKSATFYYYISNTKTLIGVVNMKPKKIEKKLTTLLALSQEGEPGLSSILIKKNETILNGFNDVAITPETALFFIQHDSDSPLYHCSIKEKVLTSNLKKDIISAIDNRNHLETKVYFKVDEATILLENNIPITRNYQFIFYFEYLNNSVVILGFSDDSNTFVIESILGHTNSTKMFNRFIIQNILPKELSKEFQKGMHSLNHVQGEKQ